MKDGTNRNSISDFNQDIIWKNGEDNCLIIFHGFGGNPVEMLPVANYLKQLPLDIYIPILPKHSKNYQTLSTITREEVHKWGYNYLLDIIKNYKKCLGYGHSMGGGILFKVLTKGVPLDGNIFSSIGGIFTYKIRFITWLAEKLRIKYISNNFKDLQKWREIPEDYLDWKKNHFNKQPIQLMRKVVTNAQKDLEYISKIKQPFLMINGTKDFLVSPKVVDFFLKNSQGFYRKGLIVKNGRHKLHFSEKREKIFSEIYQFIEMILSNSKEWGKNEIIIKKEI
jgi:esterase/lipase